MAWVFDPVQGRKWVNDGPSFQGVNFGGELPSDLWSQLSAMYSNPASLQALRERNGGGSEYIDPVTGYSFAPKFTESNGTQTFDGGTFYNVTNPEVGLGHGAYSTPGYVYNASGKATDPGFRINNSPYTFMDRWGFTVPLAAAAGAAAAGLGAAGGAAAAGEAGGAAAGAGGAGAGSAGLNGAFLGEGVASGIPAWDAAAGFGGAAGGAMDLGGGLMMGADGSITGATGAFTPATASEMAGMGVSAGGAAGLGGAASAAGNAASAAGGGGTPPNPFAPGNGGFDWTKLLGPALSAVGGIAGANAASSAADAQLQATREAQAKLEPWYKAGGNALNRLQELLGIGGNSGAADYGSAAKDFGMADFNADPGYAFRQQQQQEALQRAASASGGLGSGKYLKDAMSYSGGLASQEYNNSFNRFQTARTNKLNPLQSLAGQGQSTAQTIGDLSTQGGNAIAAGKVGQSNAFTNALTQGFSMYQNQNQMDQNNNLLASILRR